MTGLGEGWSVDHVGEPSPVCVFVSPGGGCPGPAAGTAAGLTSTGDSGCLPPGAGEPGSAAGTAGAAKVTAPGARPSLQGIPSPPPTLVSYSLSGPCLRPWEEQQALGWQKLLSQTILGGTQLCGDFPSYSNFFPMMTPHTHIPPTHTDPAQTTAE